MLLKKINIIFFCFIVGNAFGLSNSEINDAIKEYLKLNNISQSFSINNKLKLPNCKKNIEVKKRFETYKTLKIICPQDNSWTYNVRVKIQDFKKKPTKKSKLKNTEVSIIKVKNLNWPDYDISMIREENINIVIQINGKKRGLIQTKPNITEEKLFEIIQNDEKINKYFNQKNIKKKIYIKDKILNIII